MAIIILALVVFLLALIYVYVAMAVSDWLGVPFVPTYSWDVKKLLSTIKARKNDVFYDIGAGDGSVVRYAAKHWGIESYGVEKNRMLVWYARLISWITRQTDVHMIAADAFSVSYRNATIIYLYLFPEFIAKLIVKLKKECKPRTLVISHKFIIKPWSNSLEQFEEKTKTYFYRLP
ncbi:hypothetical protein COU89_03765 [Candidatus Roizmanbacteria bacterium CG10_big_fil_rev_8_21_14_0_10_45_7]|uniref:DOT1 domain-containing protein n=1 Tax=Candidatus Roizmanbacteria bacterium CG10_big_fil_rev_8_21_14_0_10_45_7 TaxID=1974854 RepID=A0A2M8KU01_9BACT|nr:MAG: hypothetical protein COU89_03765 [Candidatus Roizmanbacteria bacterium CG10_big_fil_rev_8_21_14_0_10_45_7]